MRNTFDGTTGARVSRWKRWLVWLLLALVVAVATGCSRPKAPTASEPAFVGTVVAAGEYDDESGAGVLILRQPVPRQTWAVREAVCRITSDTVVAVPSYRKTVREAGGPGEVQSALEGHVVAVRGTIGRDGIACVEVSSTAGAPFRLPWEGANSTYLERRPLIPTPLPDGRSLTASGGVVTDVLVTNPPGAVFALAATTPWDFAGHAERAITDIRYFLADSATTTVVDGEARAFSSADVNPDASPDPRTATVVLLVTRDGVFAREIRYR
jgi:hypothetical protein